jgi:hypothetical protein
MESGFRVGGEGQIVHTKSRYVAVGLRCAAVVLTAGLVAACSGGSGGHASGAHSSNAPATSAAGSKTVQSTVAPPTSQSKAKPTPARPAVASPVVQCGNHLRMGLIMTNPKQPVRTQVVTFSRAVRPAPSWEITAFQNVVTRFSSIVASHGEKQALQQPVFAYPALLRLCTQSAAH